MEIPEAKNIDYSNVDEICGYQLMLCAMFEKAGGFDYPPVVNATIINVCNEGIVWLGNVKTLLDSIIDAPSETLPLTLADVPELLASYDFFHRVSYGEPCFDYIRKIRLATVQKWLKGDKTISQTEVALLIADEINRDIHRLDQRYSSFCFRVQQEWVDELVRFGKFRNIPLSEAYQRLADIIGSNLMVYVGNAHQAKLKARWVETYLVDDPTTLDTATLRAYIPFARAAVDLGAETSSARHSTSNSGHSTSINSLFVELALRPDLHPYYRQALEITLAQYQPA